MKDTKETILKTICPFCQETLRLRKPSSSGKRPFRCPKCQKVFVLDIKADTVETVESSGPETSVVQQTKGFVLTLFRKRGIRSDVPYELHEGTNVIGAESDTAPSDIMVKDDFVSRRSIAIRLEPMPQNTYKYEFTLMRTTNPVFYNDRQIEPGTSFYMKAGDTFRVGKTRFYMATSK